MLKRFLTDASKHAAYALIFGKYLKRTDGARLLTSKETGALLSPLNKGLRLIPLRPVLLHVDLTGQPVKPGYGL